MMPVESFYAVLCEGPCGRRLNGGQAVAGAPEMFTSREKAWQAAQDAGWWYEYREPGRISGSCQIVIGCSGCMPALMVEPPLLFTRGRWTI
jgi:hypothetical protein